MAVRADTLDLGTLRLASGEGRWFDLEVAVEPFTLAAERYEVVPATVPVRLDISRTTAGGYALRLRFRARLEGPCMRCLQPASQELEVDAREVSIPGGGEELDSPYVESEVLSLDTWVRDAIALLLPQAVLCSPDCKGLCPQCGVDLNLAPPDHEHPREPDPRWAKLAELNRKDW
jgi:DUF177 domain-containing protein